ncbi:MAG TPA: hypothetical protein H9887_03305 [Candidatus Dorea intestinavium]|nr:hypothetical protein [Candidatus Dorea intestinavium]
MNIVYIADVKSDNSEKKECMRKYYPNPDGVYPKVGERVFDWVMGDDGEDTVEIVKTAYCFERQEYMVWLGEVKGNLDFLRHNHWETVKVY